MSQTISSAGKQTSARGLAPVFVLGCVRSGTTLLYHMLLSAGGFAVYLAESNVFNLLALRFGDLAARSNRENLLGVWLGSKLFRATGLNRQLIEEKIHPADPRRGHRFGRGWWLGQTRARHRTNQVVIGFGGVNGSVGGKEHADG